MYEAIQEIIRLVLIALNIILNKSVDSRLLTQALDYFLHRNFLRLIFLLLVTPIHASPELIDLSSIDSKHLLRSTSKQKNLGFSETNLNEKQISYNLPKQATLVSLGLTDEEQTWINTHPIIQIGIDGNWPPIDFINDTGAHSGITADYLSIIGKRLGVKFKPFNTGQFKTMLNQLMDGEIKVGATISRSDEREQRLLFTRPFFHSQRVIYTRDDTSDIHNITDLDGKIVAMEDGYNTTKQLQVKHPKIKIITFNSTLEALKAASFSQADAYVGNQAVAGWLRKKEQLTNLKVVSNASLGSSPQSFAVTRKDIHWAPLVGILNKVLLDISVEEHNQIMTRWLGNMPNLIQQKLKLTAIERSWIKEHPVVFYGAEKDWAPYDFVNLKGEHDGLTADYLELISQFSGLQFQPVVDDWSELLIKAKRKKIDLLPAIYFSKKRTEFLTFTQAYQSMLEYFFIRDDVDAKTLQDLNGKIVAIPKGYSNIESIKQQFPKLQILEVDNLMAAIQSVIEKKADILLETHSVLNYLLKQNNIATIRALKPWPGKNKNLHMAVTKENTVLLSILDKAITNIPKPKKQQLQEKWFGYQPKETEQRIILNESEQKWLNEHKTIRFTGDPNWLPYEAFDKKGVYIGIVAEHLKLIEQKLGIKVEIVPTESWSESVEKVKRGEIDVLSETSDSDLKSQLIFTQDYISSPVVIVMNKDEHYVEGINQILHRKVAVIKEYGYIPEIIKKYPGLSLQFVDSIQEGLTAVSTGKVDALIATLAQTSYHISELGINNIRIVGKTEFNTKLAFGIRKDFAPLLPLFNRALNSISLSEKQHIMSAWGKQKFTTKIDYVLLIEVITIFLFIIFIITYWNRKLSKEIALRKKAETQTQSIIDNIPQQIIVTTFEGDILMANPQALNKYKIHKDEVSQFNILDFYFDSNDRKTVLKEIADNGKVEQKIIPFKSIEGTKRSMMISIMPFIFHNNHSLLTIAIDLTERLEMEKAIKHNNFYSDIALELTNAGYWHIDYTDPDYYYQSERSANILGEPLKKDGRYHLHDECFSRLVEADPKTAEKTAEHYQGAIEGKYPHYDSIYTYKRPIDGKIVWIHAVGKVVRDNKQKIQYMYGVYQDISQQKETEQALGKAKQLAEAATKAKSEFLANMSHEIRTPMNAIIGFTELLNDQIKEPKLKSFVKTIQSAGNNLLNLINDILDLSKIEAGKFQIHKTPCNPHDLFDELGNIFMMKMREKNIDFILDIDPVIPQSLQLDATRLRQVLFNLIGNAVKFTEQGSIHVKARTDNEDEIHSKIDLLIDIEDSGIGISEDQQQLIFQDFEQSSGQDVRKYGGTGLGLSISKRLVEMMGGEITLHSQLGKGSTFTIKLTDVDIASLAIEVNYEKSTSSTQISFLPSKILIVDDIADNRDLLFALFTGSQIQTVTAENGLEAITLVKQHLNKQQAFDLILMDIRMPVMNGYQAAEEIKSFSNVPIVALTASVMTDEFERVKSDNFNGYLRKPVLKVDLLSELSKFLPFEEIDSLEDTRQIQIMTDTELRFLPQALNGLQKLTEQCNNISKTNKISEIQKFANDVKDLTKQYPITLICNYAEQLEDNIESFDIAAIKRFLNEYPQLIEQLEKTLQK